MKTNPLKFSNKFNKSNNKLIFLQKKGKKKIILSKNKVNLSFSKWIDSEKEIDFKSPKGFFFNDNFFYFILLPEFKKNKNNSESIREMGNKIKITLPPKLTFDIDLTAIHPKSNNNIPYPFLSCLAEGILLGDYKFEKYKSEPNKIKMSQFCFITDDPKAKKILDKTYILCQGTIWARELTNEPGNKLTAIDLLDWSKKMAKRFFYKHKALRKSEMIKKKMKGILAVNAGSVIEPTLIINEYQHPKARKKILLVGKGVTFDSGGISLKPPAGMGEMKMDMGGGASVLSAMTTLSRLKTKVNVTCLVPATDNMPSGSAQKPGDVIKMYSGKTVEVDNTDAEGRLILADALAYGIKKYQPDVVVDLATLTGACVVALGHVNAGLYSNDSNLLDKMKLAGEISGEFCWPMPLHDSYDDQIKSDVADLKNVGGRDAGSITAAKFLQHFVDDTPWIHLDIAGTAMMPKAKSYHPKGGTGYGVRLLVEFIKGFE